MLAELDFLTKTAGTNYLLIAGIVALALGTVVFITAASAIVGPKRFGETKHDTYESGLSPFTSARRRFHVRYYLVAVLFLIFDVEVLFLFPWAASFRSFREATAGKDSTFDAALAENMNAVGFTPWFWAAGVGIFFALLLVGFIYEWRKGVFDPL